MLLKTVASVASVLTSEETSATPRIPAALLAELLPAKALLGIEIMNMPDARAFRLLTNTTTVGYIRRDNRISLGVDVMGFVGFFVYFIGERPICCHHCNSLPEFPNGHIYHAAKRLLVRVQLHLTVDDHTL